MKKTDRKNKTNLVVNWPSNIFTIKELNTLNSEFKEITLRVRLKKSLDSKEVTDIGVLHNGKGRPTIVFVHGAVTEKHIDEAKNKQVILKDNLTVSVINVTQPVEVVADPVTQMQVDVSNVDVANKQ